MTDEEMDARDLRLLREEWCEGLCAKIGPRHAAATFDNFRKETPAQAKAALYVECFVDGFERGVSGLYLFGPVGTGKTHLSSAAAKLIIMRGFNVLWLNVPAWLESERERISNHTTSSPVRMVERAALVILDDVGVDKPSEWVAEKMYRLTDAIYTTGTVPLVTSNETYGGLVDRFGERTVSRLIEMTDPVELAGEDWRVREQKQRRAE